METFSALLAFCAWNSPVTGEFPTQRPVTRIFDVFFDLRPNKRLSKQWQGWWIETPSRPLWRHCNVLLSISLWLKYFHIPKNIADLSKSRMAGKLPCLRGAWLKAKCWNSSFDWVINYCSQVCQVVFPLLFLVELSRLKCNKLDDVYHVVSWADLFSYI